MSKVEETDQVEYRVTGNLTIRDITKEIELKLVHEGTVTDQYGQTKAGFEVKGATNRKEFGLTWSAVTEAGNVAVADKINLQLSVQYIES